jgi:hypothetical protein
MPSVPISAKFAAEPESIFRWFVIRGINSSEPGESGPVRAGRGIGYPDGDTRPETITTDMSKYPT